MRTSCDPRTNNAVANDHPRARLLLSARSMNKFVLTHDIKLFFTTNGNCQNDDKMEISEYLFISDEF